MRIKEIIQEEATHYGPDPGSEEWRNIFSALKYLGDQPVVWRGSNHGGTMIDYIDNSYKTGFRGSIDPTLKKIIQTLGIKNPAFAALSKDKAKFFGSPHIIIPVKGSTPYQNDDVYDIAHIERKTVLSDDENGIDPEAFEKLINGYEKKMNNPDVEIIFDTPGYYAIVPDMMVRFAQYNKFRKIKSVEELNTYADVRNLIIDYRNQITYHAKRLANLGKR